MTKSHLIRIGSRKSALALAQAELVRNQIEQQHPSVNTEIITIETSGDRFLSQNLYEIGGKGLFTKEIEQALIDNHVDIAVHSLKDLPAEFPQQLQIAATLKRHSPFDAFISYHYETVDAMPQGSVIGTSSPRRASQILAYRPDLKVVPFRGNVQTRLRKLADGVADATFLAEAGFERLYLDTPDLHRTKMPIEVMLPAVGQGTLAIQIRKNDEIVADLLKPLNDNLTALRTKAERSFLQEFDGSCRTPIAGFAALNEEELTLRGQILSFDGTRQLSASQTASSDQATALGKAVAKTLLDQAGPDFFGTQAV